MVGFIIAKQVFLFLKLVWIHSFQVNETTFPFAEQIKTEKQIDTQIRDIRVLFPKPVSQGSVWFVGAT